MEQNRCIAGPFLGKVFKIRELMFKNMANDSVKFELANDLKCANDTTLVHVLACVCVCSCVCVRACVHVCTCTQACGCVKPEHSSAKRAHICAVSTHKSVSTHEC